ncbi:MAG TPA: hypothetical protein VIR78_02150 [Malonomonas sp.]
MKDRFDILLGVLLLACAVAVVGLLAGTGSQASQRDLAVDKALEQEIAYQAKVSFLERVYAPVLELRQQGQNESALLKLDELSRKYPTEAHGELLRGEILLQLGAKQKAISHLARAVRMNGDYVDRYSPLSRRELIDPLLARELADVKRQSAENPDSRPLKATLKDLYYLQGRMAGGCE